MNLDELFKSMGLSDQEALIVSFLSENLDVSVADLANRVGVARSSIYRHLDSLEEKGWIQYLLTSQGKTVRLADLSSLDFVFKEQKDTLEETEEAFKKLINKAQGLVEVGSKPLEVRYYEGRGGLRQTYWNMQKAKGLVRVFTSLVRRKVVGDKWLEYHLIEFSRLNIPVRIIGDKEYAEYAYKEYGNREEYYGPAAELAFQFDERIYDKEGFDIEGEIIIYDEVVASHSTEGNKIVGNEINSSHLSTSLKSVFDDIWSRTSEKDRVDNLLK